MNIRTHALLAASIVAMAPAAALAQTTTANTLDTTTSETVTREDDDNDFPWGLLGLLGLAGLLGRNKKRDDDIRVDRTTNTTNRM